MKTRLANNILTIGLEGRVDSSNAPEIEREIMAVVDQAPGVAIVVDAERLEYISSAGLRVLMKLSRASGKTLQVLNVSPEVYEVLEVTQFTEILDVKKRMRVLSVEGCEVIGTGANATIYRIDRDTIVKVFNPDVSEQMIQAEYQQSKNAFLSGISTAISYDTVQVGGRTGMVYELLDAKDLLTVLKGDREHLEEHIRRFARFVRDMNRIEVDPAGFPPIRQRFTASLQRLEGSSTPEEIEKLRELFETIPDRNTFIHADCHPGSVMVQNGEFIFIDLLSSGCGHPIFDLSSMCLLYHMPSRSGSRADSPLTRHFTEEESERIWNAYLRGYLDTDDAALLELAQRQIMAVSAAVGLFAAAHSAGTFSPDFVKYLKRTALSYIDGGLEPICFG